MNVNSISINQIVRHKKFKVKLLITKTGLTKAVRYGDVVWGWSRKDSVMACRDIGDGGKPVWSEPRMYLVSSLEAS